ncbi:hypothetical protein HNR27_001980 [Ornithinibacillus bavariensis]
MYVLRYILIDFYYEKIQKLVNYLLYKWGGIRESYKI